MALSADQMIEAYGKEKFAEMVKNSPKNGPTGAERDRGIKGRVKFRYCQHGVALIDNYEPTKGCIKCQPEGYTKPKDFRPGFNIGLGYYVESRSEEKAIAKRLGLTEAG